LNTSCGINGVECQQCTGSNNCNNGQCTPACSWVNCPNGCCDGNTCNPGKYDEGNCGTNGEVCKSCGANEVCSGGVCNDFSACDSSSCNGCCKDSQCVTSTSDSSCGAGGDVCEICAPYEFCASSACQITLNSQWRVTVVEVQVAVKDYDSGLYEVEPDIFVQLKAGQQDKKTQVVDNNYSPVFNEYLFTVPASALIGPSQVTIEVWDHDWFFLDSDDLIASCSTEIYVWELEEGEATIYYCGTSPDLMMIKLAFFPELSP
jgi:hypothetical protein